MNFSKTKYILIALLLSASTFVVAQQQVMYTQYMFNGLAINPAYAGSHETLSMTVLAREQWTKIDGAPSTQTFSAHTPFKQKRIGLGLLVVNDNIGVVNQTGSYGSFAYKIDFEEKGVLSMGISAGFTYFNAAFSEVSQTDPTFSGADVRETKPNFGVGFYYTTDRLFAGISAPQLLESTFDKENQDSDSKLVRHYFINTGYLFDISPMVKLKPQVLIKYVGGAPLSVDVNASVLLQDRLWVGLSYRLFDSVDGLIQFQINENFQFGYSYDFLTTSGLKRVNGGSHEFMLNYRFSFKKDSVFKPSYF